MQTYDTKTESTAGKSVMKEEQQGFEPEYTGNINLGSGGRSLDLPDTLQSRVRSQFGLNLESIRARESSQVADMGAKAMAQGNIISFAPGIFNPNTRSGQEIIGHELHHITEQARGLASNIEGSNVHYNPASESASDVAGQMFASGGAGTMSAPSVTPAAVSSAPVQGWFGRGKKKQKTENQLHNEYMKHFASSSDISSPLFSEMMGGKTTQQFDARLNTVFARGLSVKDQIQMWKDFQGGNTEKIEGHKQRVFKRMLDAASLVTNENVFKDDFIKNNLSKSLDMADDITMISNFKNTFKDFKMEDHEKDLLKDTDALGGDFAFLTKYYAGTQGLQYDVDPNKRIRKDMNLEDYSVDSKAHNDLSMKIFLQNSVINKNKDTGKSKLDLGSDALKAYNEKKTTGSSGYYDNLDFGGLESNPLVQQEIPAAPDWKDYTTGFRPEQKKKKSGGIGSFLGKIFGGWF